MKHYLIPFFIVLAIAYLTENAEAHCDTYGGPVVGAARQALETGNINYVLLWVKKKDEREIEEAFRRSLSVRKLSPEAKELADHSFFETVVRIHRAGEGAPYTGIKPAGTDLGAAIPAADKAIETRDLSKLQEILTHEILHVLKAQFAELLEKKKFDVNDVEKGRAFVAAYVEFTHFVERVYEAAHQPAHGHSNEGAPVHSH